MILHAWYDPRKRPRYAIPPPSPRHAHIHSQMHRRQTQYLTPLLIPQLLAHHTIHPTPNRLAPLIDQHARVIVELHHAAVRALVLFCRADDDGVADVAAADFVGGGD